MSRFVCRVADSVPSTSILASVFDRHRERCLRCQADAARLRGVSRDLGGLEEETIEAPGGLHTRVMSTLPVQDAANPRRDLVVRIVARYIAAIGVTLATVAAILTRRVIRRRT